MSRLLSLLLNNQQQQQHQQQVSNIGSKRLRERRSKHLILSWRLLGRMGNCCTKEESQRPGAFADASTHSQDVVVNHSANNSNTLTSSPFGGGMLTPDGASPAIDPIVTPGSSAHSQQIQTGSDHLQQIEQMDENERQRQLNQFRWCLCV